ncbi:hypothetical protein [Brevibacillus brevis]|uniref:hypothetical protein n=1 Tax=Brevibacillus brevis TaxID=1393 RepID=UPI00163CF1E9|nr:hypothetical protein [Lysinibacillus sp. SDF0063]
MKLKFPAIYSEAELGSRGAWTGNALLPTLLLVTLHTALNNNQTALKARSNHKQSASTVTCLEGDRPNEVRIQATGRHVAGLPQPQTLDDYKRASLASFCYNKKKAWNRGIRREPQRLDRIHRQ